MIRTPWLLGMVLLGLSVMAQAAPSLPPITDVRLSQLQSGMETGCTSSGKKHGQPDVEVRAFCGCMIRVLREKVSRTDWQKAYEADAAHDQEGTRQFMVTYGPTLQVCKGEELKAGK